MDDGQENQTPAPATDVGQASDAPVDAPTTGQGDAPGVNRELSFGEKAVGLTFNPSNGTEVGDHVQTIKQEFAAVIDTLNNLREQSTNNEEKRMYSVAITEAQTAQMWGVKAVTWKP